MQKRSLLDELHRTKVSQKRDIIFERWCYLRANIEKYLELVKLKSLERVRCRSKNLWEIQSSQNTVWRFLCVRIVLFNSWVHASTETILLKNLFSKNDRLSIKNMLTWCSWSLQKNVSEESGGGLRFTGILLHIEAVTPFVTINFIVKEECKEKK